MSNKLKVSKCKHCKMDIKKRNPSGFCDHLYYPENCNICSAPTPKSKERKIKGCERCKRLEKLADCYATVIQAVYDGEKIEVADRRIRKAYKLN